MRYPQLKGGSIPPAIAITLNDTARELVWRSVRNIESFFPPLPVLIASFVFALNRITCCSKRFGVLSFL